MFSDFRGWRRQPSTILGLAAFAMLAVCIICAYFGLGLGYIAIYGTLVFALVHLILPDNTQVAADAQALAIDVIKGAALHAMGVEIPQIVRDAVKLSADVKSPPTQAELAKSTIPANAGTATQMPSRPRSAIAAVLGLFILGALALSLAACNLTPSQQAALQTDAQNAETIGCLVDGAVVPIAGPVLAALVPSTAGAVTIDETLVHPAVGAFCKAQGGTPAKVPAASSATPAVAVVPATPSVPAAAVVPPAVTVPVPPAVAAPAASVVAPVTPAAPH